MNRTYSTGRRKCKNLKAIDFIYIQKTNDKTVIQQVAYLNFILAYIHFLLETFE